MKEDIKSEDRLGQGSEMSSKSDMINYYYVHLWKKRRVLL